MHLDDARHQQLGRNAGRIARVRGMAMEGEPVRISRDPVSGLPVMHLGRVITSQDVADALDDE
ncbi:hypothetical protein [Tsukamurella soli]|uniref:Uncharacterized protein n=1 Tax=Tsukamurella soli TaxID=644556 RepID=A0ABP8J011_9ACTN